MTSTSAATTGPRWTWLERILLLFVLVVFALGTPGIGPETRPAPSEGVLVLLLVLFIAPPLVAAGASFRWPRLAAWLGAVSGLLLIALGLLDIAGVVLGPPPTGMIFVDGLMALLGVAIAWRMWVLLRARPV